MNNTEPQPARRSSVHKLVVTGLIVFAIFLTVLLAKGLLLDPNRVSSALLGKSAKDFSVALLQDPDQAKVADDRKIDLASLRGKRIVLNFWASWCVSCREEAQELEAYWRKVRGQDIAVVGIAIQDEKDTALGFAKYYGKTYMLALDEDGKVGIDYGVYGVPETFLIDTQGIIRHKEAGPVTAVMLEGLMRGVE